MIRYIEYFLIFVFLSEVLLSLLLPIEFRSRFISSALYGISAPLVFSYKYPNLVGSSYAVYISAEKGNTGPPFLVFLGVIYLVIGSINIYRTYQNIDYPPSKALGLVVVAKKYHKADILKKLKDKEHQIPIDLNLVRDELDRLFFICLAVSLIPLALCIVLKYLGIIL